MSMIKLHSKIGIILIIFVLLISIISSGEIILYGDIHKNELSMIGNFGLSEINPVNTLYVGGDGPNNFSKIQAAINSANDGDIVFVYTGFYEENVIIDKSVFLIGQNPLSTIIQSTFLSHYIAISITAINVKISGFTLQKSGYGINVKNDSSTICNNIFLDNTIGIYLAESLNNIVYNNSFKNDGIYVYKSYQNTIHNNSINNKNLIYLENQSNHNILKDVGQIILVNCTNITIKNQNISSNYCALLLENSNFCNFLNNTFSENRFDISFYKSSNNKFLNNIINKNYGTGFSISYSNNISIFNNTIKNNTGTAIYFRDSSNNTIINNTIDGNNIGLSFSGYNGGCNNNLVQKNNIIKNTYGCNFIGKNHYNIINNNNISYNKIGIRKPNFNNISNNIFYDNLSGIGLIPVSNNMIMNNSFFKTGIELSDYFNDNIVFNNSVNEKPLVYLDKVSNFVVEAAGQIILIESNGITIQNLNLSKTSTGIQIYSSNNCIVKNNIVSSNFNDGIIIINSNRNSFTDNKIINNDGCGIHIEYSDGNSINNNEICNNSNGIYIIDFIEWCTDYYLSSKNNEIIKNNIYNNKNSDAYFHNGFFNRWNNNYWGIKDESYIIQGRIFMQRGWHLGSPPSIDFTIFQMDFHPANEPFDIQKNIYTIQNKIQKNNSIDWPVYEGIVWGRIKNPIIEELPWYGKVIHCYGKTIHYIGYDFAFHSGFATDSIRYKDVIIPYDDFKGVVNNRKVIGFFTSNWLPIKYPN